jgi:AcrR family transcriptional regulator
VSKGEATRAAILETATGLAVRVGLEGLSIGALAQALGMSKSGVFAHFKSKEALQVAVLDDAADRFVEAIVRPALRAPRGEPRLRALFEAWIGWFESRHARGDGCPFTVASFELDERAGPPRDRLFAQQRDLLELIAGVAKVGVAEGHFREDLDPEQLAFEMHAMILKYHHAVRLMGDAKAPTRVRTAFERLVADARR